MVQSPKKILIVEDDPVLQRMYMDRLVRENLVVIQATTGQQGLSLAIQHKPDIIILDIMLPGGLNGFDLLEHMRRDSAFKKTPIIMFTSLEKERETARKVGVTDFLVKSHQSVDDMLEVIRKHLQPSFWTKFKHFLLET